MQLLATFLRRQVWLAAVCAVVGTTQAATSDPVGFNRDIRPILVAKCFSCHGPAAKIQKTKLRLFSPEEASRDLEGRRAVVGGKPEQSELIRRINSDDRDQMMPPPSEGNTLSLREKELLETWIAQGAKWERHWAFILPQATPMPAVKDSSWPINPIDSFILARLEAEGVAPSPDADRRTLLRRLSFDLTGLPPPAEEVDDFLNDPAPDAYLKRVSKLINSPHFGERMAMNWLDLVRYADTDGYHGDNPRSVWPYRDYVISAFNSNLPFDKFTMQQIAGDLFPAASVAEKVASTYNMLIKTTEEDGANAKEYLLRYAADRVRNTASVWLGLTLGCAECHDHKTDPLTAVDFYSFSAFFADLKEEGVGRRVPATIPNAAEAARLATLNQQINELSKRESAAVDTVTLRLEAALQELEESFRADRFRWMPVVNRRLAARGASQLLPRADGSIAVTPISEPDDFTVEISPTTTELRSLRLEVFRDPETALALQRQGIPFEYCLTEVEVDVIQPGVPARRVTVTTAFSDIDSVGHPADHAIDGDPKTGWMVGDTSKGSVTRIMFRLAETVAATPSTRLLIHLKNSLPNENRNLRRFRISAAQDANSVFFPDDHGLPPAVDEALSRPASLRTEKDRDEMFKYHLKFHPEIQPLEEVLRALLKERGAFLETLPASLISETVPPRTTRVQLRGNWMDESGPIVMPAVPAVFAQASTSTNRLTRLELAQWLVSRDNPLTARVFVNRLWKILFGTGIVTTPGDFGLTGDAPSHPELLDQMALEFMASGWSIKHIVSLMVTSHAYRQTSVGRPDLEARDPRNRLFARQGRWRIEAEMIRDSTLFSAGMLMTNIGGPSTFPHQPEGYLDQLDFPARVYHPSAGPAQYRRGLYAFWQRTFLNPALSLFDAPSREECTAERPVSNTPLQALALLNNVSHLEAARVLAMDAYVVAGASVPARVEWIFRRVLGRRPDAEEARELAGLFERQRQRLVGRADDLMAVNRIGQIAMSDQVPEAEAAAGIAVARAVLNLHETITRY